MYFQIPSDPAKARPLMQRFLQENLGNSSAVSRSRRRPQPPRSAGVTVGSGQVALTWVGPQNMAGVLGFNVYQNNENNRILSINNPDTLQAVVTGLAAATKYAFYISSFTDLFESIRIQVLATTP